MTLTNMLEGVNFEEDKKKESKLMLQSISNARTFTLIPINKGKSISNFQKRADRHKLNEDFNIYLKNIEKKDNKNGQQRD